MPQPPTATFKSLPPRQILTLNFDAPEMWLVEPVVAEHDLDNLKLEQLGHSASLSAEYELEALMLTGRCMDLHARRRELVCQLSFPFLGNVQSTNGCHRDTHKRLYQDTFILTLSGLIMLLL